MINKLFLLFFIVFISDGLKIKIINPDIIETIPKSNGIIK